MPKLTDQKNHNWKNLIENWDLKESSSLMDGYLKHIVMQNSSSTNVDRRAILFSSVLCLCKAISNEKWKFKEKIWLRKYQINDQVIIPGKFIRLIMMMINPHVDHEHVFEIQTEEKNYILAARTEQEKTQWLCLLLYIRNKRSVDKRLRCSLTFSSVFCNVNCIIFWLLKMHNKFF